MTTPTTEAPVQIDSRSRTPLVLATVAYAIVVAWITLGPQGAVSQLEALVRGVVEHSAFPFLPFAPLSLLFAELDFETTANVLMFVPFGILAALWSPRSSWFVLALTGVAASCAIEVTQFFVPGRVTDFGDVLANGAGVALGALMIVGARALDRFASAHTTARVGGAAVS